MSETNNTNTTNSDNLIPIQRPQIKSSNVQKTIMNPTFDENEIPSQFIEKSKYPTETVELVSKGWFYPESNPLSSGMVELKQVTGYQEDILTNQSFLAKGIALKKFIESLLVDKRIKIDDFLACDFKALLLYCRILAYGSTYTVKVKCPSCSTDQELDVDISKFKTKNIDLNQFERGVNQFTFQLPNCGKTLTFKLLTQKDLDNIDTEDKMSNKVNKRSSTVTIMYKHMIIAIDGEENKGFIKKFVENEFLSKDILALKKHIKQIEPNLPWETEFNCNNCNYVEERLKVPFEASFLWPDQD